MPLREVYCVVFLPDFWRCRPIEVGLCIPEYFLGSLALWGKRLELYLDWEWAVDISGDHGELEH